MASGESLQKGGGRGPAIVPGKPDESLLYKAVTRSGELKMPPGGPISEKEVALLRQWIEAGAHWPQKRQAAHWAYLPIAKPAVPAVKNRQFVFNPVDAFVVAAYEKQGLPPAPLADKGTLLRRVTYDLIGLPPSAREVALFLNDSSPQAYEKVVDRLLGDEQHGVNFARHWLDVLRYVDTDEHMPAYTGIYRWREWVIHALNRDLPYDQFVKSQLLGDLMDDPAAMFAVGFLARGAETEKDEKRLIAFSAV